MDNQLTGAPPEETEDKPEHYQLERVTFPKEPGRIQRCGLLKSHAYSPYCASLIDDLERIYSTQPQDVRCVNMLWFLTKRFEQRLSSNEREKAYCEMTLGYQMLVLFAGWDYKMLQKKAQEFMDMIQNERTTNSDFLEVSQLNLLCYLNLKLGKISKASSFFDKAKRQVTQLEPCDITADVYRILGIWHTKMAYHRSASNTSIQKEHFQKARVFFEKNKSHLLAFSEWGGLYKTYDIPLSDLWIVRCKLKLPVLLLQPGQDKRGRHTQKTNYKIDLLSHFILESTICLQDIDEAKDILSATKTQISTLEKVPVFMDSQVQALEVFLHFRKAQTLRSKTELSHALQLSCKYQLSRYEYGSGWISVVPHVIQRLNEQVFTCPQQFLSAVNDGNSYSETESCPSDVI